MESGISSSGGMLLAGDQSIQFPGIQNEFFIPAQVVLSIAVPKPLMATGPISHAISALAENIDHARERNSI